MNKIPSEVVFSVEQMFWYTLQGCLLERGDYPSGVPVQWADQGDMPSKLYGMIRWSEMQISGTL